MNKKRNTIIFLFAATVFNIIMTMLCFFALLVIYTRFLFSLLPEDSVAWALPVIFVLAIVASVFIYKFLIKVLMKKVEVEKYFDPIFNRRQPRG